MVKCEICGKRFKQLTSSGHLRKHQLSLDGYKKKFPNAVVVSKETIEAHSADVKKRIASGNHFVPFRDIKGFAQKVHDKYKEGPVDYKCIRCSKIKQANRYLADRRKFCSNECHSQHIKEHPELYVERNAAISRGTTGVPKRGKTGGYSRARGGYREDIGHYVRSRWEADICRLFKSNNKPYEYETYVLRLKDGDGSISWIVDFVDPTCFMSDGLIEVKGWWDDKSKKKLNLLEKQRPDIYNKMRFIEYGDMKELIKKYSKTIDHWESDR